MAGTADYQPLRLVTRIALRIGIGLVLGGKALIGQVSHRASLPDFPAHATRVRLFHLGARLRYRAMFLRAFLISVLSLPLIGSAMAQPQPAPKTPPAAPPKK